MTALVTNDGVADLIATWAASPSRPRYVQMGTGSGATQLSNDLIAPIGSRLLGATSQETTTITGDTYRVVASVGVSAVYSITEVGVFDAETGGNLLIYGDFDAIHLAAGDSLVFEIDVIASAV